MSNPLTPIYTHTARTHTPHSVCSYIFPHAALSSGHPVTIDAHTHKSTHITETKPHVTTERRVMLVFESKDAHLYFFLFIYYSSLTLAGWNYGALNSGIKTILQRSHHAVSVQYGRSSCPFMQHCAYLFYNCCF